MKKKFSRESVTVAVKLGLKSAKFELLTDGQKHSL